MPYFSETSKQRLLTCDPRLQLIAFELIKYFDITVVCGYRDEQAQNDAFNKGYSKVQYPNSKHNVYPSLAVDIAPYPTLYKERIPFYYMAGYFKAIADRKGIPIRWGGDFNNDYDFFNDSWVDRPHFELITGGM